MIDRILIALRKLAGDRQGTVLIEFAVAFPVLLLLYMGSFILSDAIACNRKVTVTARSLTDLATRYPALSHAEAQTILNASAQALSPYDSSKATIILSEVQVTSATQAKVIWSKALNGTQLTTNLTITIPSGMAPVNTYMIVGQVSYAYKPPAKAATFGGPMTLSDTIVMLPRVSDQVPLS